MRTVVSSVAVSFVALLFGACANESGGGPPSYWGGADYAADCSQFASCNACTPINGCGWCYNSDGTGTCAASPDQCPTQSFSWTWDPDGCRVVADADVEPASTPVRSEAGVDAATDAAAAVSAEAGTLVPGSDGLM